MLILRSTNILDMELDLIDIDFVSHPSGGTGRNLIIFEVDISSSTNADERKRDILILGRGPRRGLEHTLCSKKSVQLTLLKIIKKSVWAGIIIEQTVIYYGRDI